ncbi:EscU/YscU/HrcU family type III secretion system export apparatus switch protein [Terriglobus sp.]|uniref:EscU/YscU/HrcU family type III secretion system export apparatus switch protein n=1 Tax=Terriglobus sp. TaxID=1889013 RepID=UPI003B00ADCC
MSADKQEKATDQRKKKAREAGDVPVSRELTSAGVLLGSLLVLAPASTAFLQLWRHGVEASLAAAPGTFDNGGDLLRACAMPFAPAFAPLVLVLVTALAASLCLGVAQAGGLQLHAGSVGLKLERVSPFSHAKQMFGARTATRLGKSILPAGVLIWIAARTLERQIIAQPFLTPARLPVAISACYHLALTAAWIAVAWSGLDYALERRSWAQKLRMSKQDIRDEMRESNGNPQTKGRIRQVQRAMRRRRIKADIQQATVVVTNPTHYAVALSFDMETMAAPRVLAKGRELHAFAIREEARWAGVPIVENPPLARSLYRTVEEGQAIPMELYTAVAAILAFLLRRDAPPQTGGYPSANSAGHGMPKTLEAR